MKIKGDPKKVMTALLGVGGIEKAEPHNVVSGVQAAGENEYIVTGRQDCDIREDLFRALAKADLPLLSSISAAASLEDVFLKLTAGKDVK